MKVKKRVYKTDAMPMPMKPSVHMTDKDMASVSKMEMGQNVNMKGRVVSKMMEEMNGKKHSSCRIEIDEVMPMSKEMEKGEKHDV